MKIKTELVLVMPPQPSLLNGFASGLVSLANYVAAAMPDIAISILDLSTYSFEQAKEAVIASSISKKALRTFVGITTTTASYQSALSIARIVKSINSNAITVLGGHHASSDPENILHNHADLVDLIAIGEGERTLCDLLKSYPELEKISGIAYLRQGEFYLAPPGKLLTTDELDSIPINYKDNGLIGVPGKFDHVTYISARGCPLPCAFCAVSNQKIRAKSINAVIRDIKQLLDMGFSRIAIEDNFFAHSPARTKEMCEALVELRKNYKSFTWDCQTRVEALAREGTIEMLAKSGCEAVYIGVESLNPESLVYLNKTKNPQKYLSALYEKVIPNLLVTDIDCYINLQFGIPGESLENNQQTLTALKRLGKLAEKHNKVITVFPQLHVVYPGTFHYFQGIKDQRFPKNVFEFFTAWESKKKPIISWFGEHFAHGTGGIPEGILNSELLKIGKFYINGESVIRITHNMEKTGRFRGIKVFSYRNYIIN